MAHASGDGNGWVRCDLGHRHWGRFGAAGLLLTDGTRVVLQLRSEHTHQGGTWALPGGARDSHEDARTAALREAAEEADVDPARVVPFTEWADEHGGWTYTTVLATAPADLAFAPINFESDAIRWWDIADVTAAAAEPRPVLTLHAGLAAAWPHLHARLTGVA